MAYVIRLHGEWALFGGEPDPCHSFPLGNFESGMIRLQHTGLLFCHFGQPEVRLRVKLLRQGLYIICLHSILRRSRMSMEFLLLKTLSIEACNTTERRLRPLSRLHLVSFNNYGFN